MPSKFAPGCDARRARKPALTGRAGHGMSGHAYPRSLAPEQPGLRSPAEDHPAIIPAPNGGSARGYQELPAPLAVLSTAKHAAAGAVC